MNAAAVVIPVTCPRCREREGHQIYIIQGELGDYAFDQRKARAIVSDGRPAFVVPPDIIRRFLEVNKDWDAGHLDHVDMTAPGIVGQRFGGLALFDGTHRAARSLRDGLDFTAYVLDYPESASCLMFMDPADIGPEIVAREISGVLRNNPHVEKIEVEITCSPADDVKALEVELRKLLTDAENARVIPKFRSK